MPLPPPPATALISTGQPIAAASRGQASGDLVLAEIAGRHRHAGRGHQPLGGVLQAHGPDRRRRRPDPDEAGRRSPPRRSRRSRRGSRSPDGSPRRRSAGRPSRIALGAADSSPAPAAGRWRPPASASRDMRRAGVGLANRPRPCARPSRLRGADDPPGDLAAVGDQERADHPRAAPPTPLSSRPMTRTSIRTSATIDRMKSTNMRSSAPMTLTP